MELYKESGEMVLTGKAGRNVIGRWKAVGLVRKNAWLGFVGEAEGDIGRKLGRKLSCRQPWLSQSKPKFTGNRNNPFRPL